eukprot:7870267-Alexandrium_andersonii.AAC.2
MSAKAPCAAPTCLPALLAPPEDWPCPGRTELRAAVSWSKNDKTSKVPRWRCCCCCSASRRRCCCCDATTGANASSRPSVIIVFKLASTNVSFRSVMLLGALTSPWVSSSMAPRTKNRASSSSVKARKRGVPPARSNGLRGACDQVAGAPSVAYSKRKPMYCDGDGSDSEMQFNSMK